MVNSWCPTMAPGANSFYAHEFPNFQGTRILYRLHLAKYSTIKHATPRIVLSGAGHTHDTSQESHHTRGHPPARRYWAAETQQAMRGRPQHRGLRLRSESRLTSIKSPYVSDDNDTQCPRTESHKHNAHSKC